MFRNCIQAVLPVPLFCFGFPRLLYRVVFRQPGCSLCSHDTFCCSCASIMVSDRIGYFLSKISRFPAICTSHTRCEENDPHSSFCDNRGGPVPGRPYPGSNLPFSLIFQLLKNPRSQNPEIRTFGRYGFGPKNYSTGKSKNDKKSYDRFQTSILDMFFPW